MATIVTLGVFSGRPDPHWTLSGNQEAEFGRRIAAAPVVATAPLLDEPLGYRGFRARVDNPGAAAAEYRVYRGWITGAGQPRDDRGRALERWLLDTGRSTISADLATYVAAEISSGP